jgi:hypothetical protein
MNPLMQFGWVNDPAAVARVLATLPRPRFGAAAPHLLGTGVGKSVLLSDAARKVTGRHLPAQQQPRGTCVSRGWSRSVDYLQCVLIASGSPLEYRSISHAAVYGMAREIGGDLSYQDGAVGAWAARAVSEWGTVTNDDAKDRDAGYDDLAVEWGARGVPQAVKELARKHLVRTVSLVTSAEQARDALCNGYPVSCCSDQGFTMARDQSGRCTPEGSWSHCMMWSGYRDDRRQFLVEQSWGQNVPSGPLGDLDIPDNAFWIDWGVADRMLRQQDSFALSGYDGFPAQRLDWLL